MTCYLPADEARTLVNQPSPQVRTRVRPMCRTGEETVDCLVPQACDDPPDTIRHAIMQAPAGTEDWNVVAYVCLGEGEDLTQQISMEMVLTQWQALTWPAADLVIQPPKGETFVNLDTIFYTTATGPQTQTITLLGQQLQIEATPASYTWHWVTGNDPATAADRVPYTTTEPGTPYPDQTITHAYTRPGVTVHPRVDLTYRGRYRIGTGGWIQIPQPRTITGTPGSLTVLEAPPTLVR